MWVVLVVFSLNNSLYFFYPWMPFTPQSKIDMCGISNRDVLFIYLVFCVFDSHKKCEWVMISVGPAGQRGDCLVWQKLQRCSFLIHCKCDKYQTLHDGTTHWALPIHPTFSDLDRISRSAVLNSFNWKVYVFIWLMWNFMGLFTTSNRSWI